MIFCNSEGVASVDWVEEGSKQSVEEIGLFINAALSLSSEETSLQPLTINVNCLGVPSRIHRDHHMVPGDLFYCIMSYA